MTERLRWLPVLLFTLMLSSCDFLGDVLEAGFWLGVIMVVLVIALVAWGISKLMG